jgi:hypothetical protein
LLVVVEVLDVYDTFRAQLLYLGGDVLSLPPGLFAFFPFGDRRSHEIILYLVLSPIREADNIRLLLVFLDVYYELEVGAFKNRLSERVLSLFFRQAIFLRHKLCLLENLEEGTANVAWSWVKAIKEDLTVEAPPDLLTLPPDRYKGIFLTHNREELSQEFRRTSNIERTVKSTSEISLSIWIESELLCKILDMYYVHFQVVTAPV